MFYHASSKKMVHVISRSNFLIIFPRIRVKRTMLETIARDFGGCAWCHASPSWAEKFPYTITFLDEGACDVSVGTPTQILWCCGWKQRAGVPRTGYPSDPKVSNQRQCLNSIIFFTTSPLCHSAPLALTCHVFQHISYLSTQNVISPCVRILSSLRIHTPPDRVGLMVSMPSHPQAIGL